MSPEYQLEEFGLRDLLDEETSGLDEQLDRATSALIAAGATTEESARLEELDAQLLAAGAVDEQVVAAGREREDLWAAVSQRGREGDPQAAAAYDAQVTRQVAAHRLWLADVAAYRQSVIDTARALLDERGVAANVVINEDEPAFPMPGVFYDELGDVITSQVIARAPLPMTGQAPDYSAGTPAEAVRRAGRDYLARLDQT